MQQEQVVELREFFPGRLTHYDVSDGIVRLRTDNGCLLNVYVLTDTIIRFRFAPEGYFPADFSYAIAPDFQPACQKLSVVERKSYLSIKTTELECRIKKEGLLTTILNTSGKVVLEDDKGFHWEPYEHGGSVVMMSKQAREQEYFTGLGDKSCHLNLRGARLQNWNTDCFGYGADTDPLYRTIPFYYGMHAGVGYGVFFDNSYRTQFDFASERAEATSFWAHHGEMNYYFIYGPDLNEVAKRYHDLTGRPELPPMWSLGFHQCRWSYYPEAEVKRIAHEFRSREIPCDAIYLDIDYMDAYRCFTWDYERFPDPARMIQELKDQGFRTVVIIDPGIKIDHDYWVFTEGLARDAYLKTAEGPYAEAKVWPGDCFFPDYTRPDVREWWGALFKDLVRKMGVQGVWNDMNEPAAFEVPTKTLPPEVRFDYEGIGSSHERGHNVYGMQMSRASYEGVKQFAYPDRPILITRASYAGGQRYASVWTGDNVASWEHLKLASLQSQRLSISGFSFVGSDIGGFNDYPDGELFVRWLQLGIFHPLCRVHSIGYHGKGDEAVDEEAVAKSMAEQPDLDQEPWSYGEPFTTIARRTIELRYQLMGIIYTAFWQHVQDGTPVLRPLSFEDQHDPETLHRMEEFILGDHLLACPISEQGADGRMMYLPKGHWYRFQTGEEFEGGQEVFARAVLSDIPMFVRGGAVLPIYPVMQYTQEKPIEILDLHVYLTEGEESSTLYEDAGDGYDYEQGNYRLAKFWQANEGRNMRLQQTLTGKMNPSYDSYRLILHGVKAQVVRCSVDGKAVSYYRRGSVLEVRVPADFRSFRMG